MPIRFLTILKDVFFSPLDNYMDSVKLVPVQYTRFAFRDYLTLIFNLILIFRFG